MRKSRVSHSGVGSDKTRKSEKVDPKELMDKVSGAQEMLDKLQEEQDENVEPEPQSMELQNLRELIFLGRNSEVFEVGGFKFEICTLKNDQKRDLVKVLSMTGKDLSMYIRPYTLATCISSVNSVPLDELYEMYGGEDDSFDEFERKLFVVDQWQSALVETLFAKYEELVERSDEFFNPSGEEIKK